MCQQCIWQLLHSTTLESLSLSCCDMSATFFFFFSFYVTQASLYFTWPLQNTGSALCSWSPMFLEIIRTHMHTHFQVHLKFMEFYISELFHLINILLYRFHSKFMESSDHVDFNQLFKSEWCLAQINIHSKSLTWRNTIIVHKTRTQTHIIDALKMMCSQCMPTRWN